MTHHEDRQLDVLEDIVGALKAIKGELAMTREYMKVRDQRPDRGQILESLPEGMTLEQKVQFRKDWDARVLDKHSLPKGD